ncbi:ImcF-related family protein [Cupriavidus campinensis]
MAALVVWFHGDLFELTSREAKVSVLLWIPFAVVLAILVYLLAVLLGADKAIARLFARNAGETPSASVKSLKYDVRLDELRHELRSLLGWRWRYRIPWLMLCGDDATINAVAPGLKQTGVLRAGDVVLVHASPSGIEAPTWHKQLRTLRPRRPVDAMVQLMSHDDTPTPTTEPWRAIAAIETGLGWAAPLIFLHPVMVEGARPDENFAAIGAFPADTSYQTRGATANALHDALQSLEARTAALGVQYCFEPTPMPFVARISAYIGEHRTRIVDRWAAWQASMWRRAPLAGVMFAPLFAAPAMPVLIPAEDAPDELAKLAMNAPAILQTQPASLLPAWQEIGRSAKRYRGRRVGIYPATVFAGLALMVVGLWTAGMLVSGVRNAQDLRAAQHAIQAIETASNPAARLRALLALQHQIERYAPRAGHHTPLIARLGLNRDDALLAALWKPYTEASRRLLVTPIQQDLEDSLADLAQLQVAGLDAQASQWAMSGHQTLKTYLMLANPERAEPDFLAPQLIRHWQTDARITPGERDDLAERLLQFHAEHLKAHPDWRIAARPELVSGARQTVLAVIGQRNAQDTVYRQVIDGIGSKYPDQTLVSLTPGTDARGLIRAHALVPGAYTRQAYDGHVANAIEQAARRTQVEHDWVLSDGQAPPSAPPPGLQAALTAQYFADYADHWQRFMNSLQWAPAPTLPAAIDQLKLMADARQSPVIALMKSLEYQGSAGARKDSLSDTLVAKAQDMLGKKPAAPEALKPDTAGPLGPAFGPLLRLAAANQANSGEMSLQRFLDRATALRLRLQQVSNSPDADAQARQMAQALFQGKGAELADTQAYAQQIAASLGAEWAGMGETLFVRPIAQATQTVLQPAQASLNDAWRESIVMAWGRSFAGRYPFADTANDASLPELARFLRPQGGLIHGFLAAQLAGVLELQGDQWKPAATGGQALAFDPAFLAAINRLQRIGVRLLAQGEPRYRFEVQPIPTPGLTDTLLTLDGQTLHYYNQRETWQAMTWPGSHQAEPGTRLQWQTEAAGTNKHYEFGGRWGLVRMLERASIEPIDSATFRLTWHGVPDSGAPAPPDAATDADSLTRRAAALPAAPEVTYPIRYQMRTELGHGPLELLALRGFVLPSRIFANPAPHAAARGL